MALTQLVFGYSGSQVVMRRGVDAVLSDTAELVPAGDSAAPDEGQSAADRKSRRRLARAARAGRERAETPAAASDSDSVQASDTAARVAPDSLVVWADTLSSDSIVADSLTGDTLAVRDTTRKGSMLEAPIKGKNRDSLVFNVRDKMVYVYGEGDITYQTMNMKADYMRINMDTRVIRA